MEVTSFESTSAEEVDVCFIFDNTISENDLAWDNSVDMINLLASYGISTESNLLLFLLQGGAVNQNVDDAFSSEEFSVYVRDTMPSTPGPRDIKDSFEACLEMFTNDDNVTQPTIFLVTHDGPDSVTIFKINVCIWNRLVGFTL